MFLFRVRVEPKSGRTDSFWLIHGKMPLVCNDFVVPFSYYYYTTTNIQGQEISMAVVADLGQKFAVFDSKLGMRIFVLDSQQAVPSLPQFEKKEKRFNRLSVWPRLFSFSEFCNFLSSFPNHTSWWLKVWWGWSDHSGSGWDWPMMMILSKKQVVFHTFLGGWSLIWW